MMAGEKPVGKKQHWPFADIAVTVERTIDAHLLQRPLIIRVKSSCQQRRIFKDLIPANLAVGDRKVNDHIAADGVLRADHRMAKTPQYQHAIVLRDNLINHKFPWPEILREGYQPAPNLLRPPQQSNCRDAWFAVDMPHHIVGQQADNLIDSARSKSCQIGFHDRAGGGLIRCDFHLLTPVF